MMTDTPTPADLAQDEAEAWYEGPENLTEGGVRCGACKGRHETPGNVRWCYDLRAEMQAEAAAEQAAEAASELAFARSLEARAENGTWFGPQTEADNWG
jgi:hypothetical protein